MIFQSKAADVFSQQNGSVIFIQTKKIIAQEGFGKIFKVMKREELEGKLMLLRGRNSEVKQKLKELRFVLDREIYDSHFAVLFRNNKSAFPLDNIKTGWNFYFSSVSDFNTINVEDFLKIELPKQEQKVEEKPKFYPFQKVLVRNFNFSQWQAGFFDSYDINGLDRYKVVGNGFYLQCIDYKSNKHLHNTTKNPE